MSIAQPVSKLVVGEHFNHEHYSSHYEIGVNVPPEDMLRLHVHLGMLEEVSSFNTMLANFDKKYIETYPLNVGDLVRIWIGRGANKPQIFQGRVEEKDAEAEATENYLTLKGRCIGEDLFRRLVTEIYENKKGEYIVRDLIDNYSRLKHVRDGTELIEDTDTTYTELEYDKTKLKDILDFIAKTADKIGIVGFDFRVEYDGKFAFFPRNTKTSPISLTDVIKYAMYKKTIHRIRNRIYVYGAAEKKYPTDGDAWTESLTPADGVWSSGTGSGNVYFDTVTKIMGSGSVKHVTESSDYYGCAVFTYGAGKELDANKYPSLTFQIYIQTPFSGNVTVVLEDTAGMSVRQEITVPKKNEFQLFSFPVGKKNSDQWTHSIFNTQPFNWSSVKKIIFYAHFPGTGTGNFHIDNLFFNHRRWSAIQEDFTSQMNYGLRELAETDEELHSDEECSARGQAFLVWLKDPAESITLQTEILDFGTNRLQPGDKIHVTLPNENVDGDYRILTVDYWLGETQELPITIELGKETPLLADYLYTLRSKSDSLARYKSGS